MTRRSSEVSGYVNYPKCEARTMDDAAGFYDSKEGGTEVWLIFPTNLREDRCGFIRGICMTGFYVGIVEYDAIASESGFDLLPGPEKTDHVRAAHRKFHPLLDGAICIGASGMSPWDCARKAYWEPTFNDLTEEGRQLWHLLVELYGVQPQIVVVLDT